MERSEMLEIQSAARKLGISVQAVHALCDRGTLPFRWLGGRKFVTYGAVLDLLSNDEYIRRRNAAKRREEVSGK